jgi:hypothetical protein
MGRRASTVQEWFSLNQEELIQCPYQLGNLKITKSSCLKQRRRSDEWVYGTTPDNYIVYALEMHLKVCRQCEVASTAPAPGEGLGPSGRRFKKMGRIFDRNVHRPVQASPGSGETAKPRKEPSLGNDQYYRKQH